MTLIYNTLGRVQGYLRDIDCAMLPEGPEVTLSIFFSLLESRDCIGSSPVGDALAFRKMFEVMGEWYYPPVLKELNAGATSSDKKCPG